MGRSLEEYAADHGRQEAPAQELAAVKEVARSYEERKQRREDIAKLKKSIEQQIEQGNEAHFILYAAITALGLLLNDEEWAEDQKTALDIFYKDLQQRSFLAEKGAAAAEMLENAQEAYIEKIQKGIKTQLNKSKKLTEALEKAQELANSLQSE